MRRALLLLVFLAASLTPQYNAFAQGCSQCRDTVSQTNPAVQRSYRGAIAILLTGVLGVTSAGVFVMRRFGR